MREFNRRNSTLGRRRGWSNQISFEVADVRVATCLWWHSDCNAEGGHREIRMNTKLPAKPPMIGQRTYVGMAQWYLEAALRELGPNARHQLYIDLRKLLDRLERKDRSEAA